MRIVPALVACLAIAGCTGDAYDQRGGQAITNSISNAGSPLVLAVEYRPGDDIDPATTSVSVMPGVTRADAQQLFCTVLKPIVEAQQPPPPDSYSLVIWDADWSQVLATDEEPCA